MREHSQAENRSELLAYVAEMYYLEGRKQSEIAERVGVTRSMVSRMLTDARQQGIVEISVQRPLQEDRALSQSLIERFGLLDAFVVANLYSDNEQLLRLLGAGGGRILKQYLATDIVLGVVWGTTTKAVVDALDSQQSHAETVVQLSGALEARSSTYDGHVIVSQLAAKLNGEAMYLNAPLFVDAPEMVSSLSATHGVREAIEIARTSDVALLGVGGTDPSYCSYCLTNNLTSEQLREFVAKGAVGVVYGHYFDKRGRLVDTGFYDRIIGINLEELLSIPVRIGVAGGPVKLEAVGGVLRGQYVNVMVTDSVTASQILEDG